MSNPLAIAAVTAVLMDLLNNGLIQNDLDSTLGVVKVTARPPGRIPTGNGAAEESQLNLFMYQVTPNLGWRNVGMPSRDGRGARISNPPLALDLHYLLTAYSAEDFHGEILMGYAMHLLHETPVLTREAIRASLAPTPPLNGSILPPAFENLAANELADQVEQIKVYPQFLNTEEMSKLWTAFQSSYRPTAAYQVSVVLIESKRPVRSPLPVLTRGPVDPETERDHGVAVQPFLLPPYPTLTAVRLPNGQVSAQLGDTLTLEGHHLEGSDPTVRFSTPRLDDPIELTPIAEPSPTHFEVRLPEASDDFVAGIYTVSVSLQRPGETTLRTTNELPLALAPQITTDFPIEVDRDAEGHAIIVLTCRPEVQPGQRVALVVGDREVLTDSGDSPADTLAFTLEDVEPGDYFLRLRIDGIDGLLVNRAVSPPVYFDHKVIIS
jgi:hypothetical protein